MSRAADVGKASCRDDGGHPDAAITEGETGARAKNSKQNEVTFVTEIEALKWGERRWMQRGSAGGGAAIARGGTGGGSSRCGREAVKCRIQLFITGFQSQKISFIQS